MGKYNILLGVMSSIIFELYIFNISLFALDVSVEKSEMIFRQLALFHALCSSVKNWAMRPLWG